MSESGELAPPDAAAVLVFVAVVEEMNQIREMLQRFLGFFGDVEIFVGGHDVEEG